MSVGSTHDSFGSLTALEEWPSPLNCPGPLSARNRHLEGNPAQ